jgi:hypothetical protein
MSYRSVTDARIDQVLNALRTTEPPSGLEQRIAARLAQAAEARALSATTNPTHSSYITVILNAVKDPCSLLAPAKLYTVAAAALTLLVALTTLTLHHRPPSATARTTPTVLTPTSGRGLERAGLQSRHNPPASTAALATEGISAATTTQILQGFPATSQVPQGFSLGSHSPNQKAGVLTPATAQDPDTIALAETLAPSRPAPPMPLTAQEHLLFAATRPGQPIQLAELDLARAPILRAAAEARETASLDHYVKSLLAPFAIADELSPTTFSQPQETSTPAPPPTSNPSN